MGSGTHGSTLEETFFAVAKALINDGNITCLKYSRSLPNNDFPDHSHVYSAHNITIGLANGGDHTHWELALGANSLKNIAARTSGAFLEKFSPHNAQQIHDALLQALNALQAEAKMGSTIEEKDLVPF